MPEHPVPAVLSTGGAGDGPPYLGHLRLTWTEGGVRVDLPPSYVRAWTVVRGAPVALALVLWGAVALGALGLVPSDPASTAAAVVWTLLAVAVWLRTRKRVRVGTLRVVADRLWLGDTEVPADQLREARMSSGSLVLDLHDRSWVTTAALDHPEDAAVLAGWLQEGTRTSGPPDLDRLRELARQHPRA
ncbi:MAG: hypothetical protein R3F61_32530 [Myxococcota bacterium]